MAQWFSFVNLTWLPLMCKNSGAMHLWSYGSQAGWQVDKMIKVYFGLKF